MVKFGGGLSTRLSNTPNPANRPGGRTAAYQQTSPVKRSTHNFTQNHENGGDATTRCSPGQFSPEKSVVKHAPPQGLRTSP